VRHLPPPQEADIFSARYRSLLDSKLEVSCYLRLVLLGLYLMRSRGAITMSCAGLKSKSISFQLVLLPVCQHSRNPACRHREGRWT